MIKKAIIAFLLAFSLSGCAFLNNNKPLNEESLEILELKKSIAETNLRLDELNNKFLLLHEKVEANSLKAGSVSTEAAAAPPEGLKVVKLAEEEKETPASGPEGLYNDGQDFFWPADIMRRGRHSRNLFGIILRMTSPITLFTG